MSNELTTIELSKFTCKNWISNTFDICKTEEKPNNIAFK